MSSKYFKVKSGVNTPNVTFYSSTVNTSITASYLDSNVLSFSGTSGQLFSIADSMTGTIFAVNDISGVPSIEVDDDGTIRFAETFGNVLIGTANNTTGKLQVAGTVTANTFAIPGYGNVINSSGDWLGLTVGTTNQILYKNSSNVLTGSNGLQYDGTSLKVSGNLESTYKSGDEGGEIFLSNAATNTTIVNGVTIDVYQNRLRFFEAGGSNRGVFIDITNASSGVGSNLLATPIRSISAGATSGSLIIDANITDLYIAEALSGAITFAQPSGSPANGQKLLIRIKDNGTARSITWTTSAGAFRAIGVTLPTTTVLSKVTYVGAVYNSTDSFWDVVAVTTQA